MEQNQEHQEKLERTAVVLTYPGHFLSTALTVCSIQQHISGISDIVVLADGWSPQTWTNYTAHCEQLYGTRVVDLRTFPKFGAFRRDPWVRQQMYKLHLDEILDLDRWFFSDGDVLFNFDVPANTVPYILTKYQGVPLSERDPEPSEMTSQQLYYVNNTLGINSAGLEHNGKRICTSGAPFRDMTKLDIYRLRTYIETAHNTSVEEYHLGLSRDTRHSVSEWELLEHFRQYILSESLDFVYYPPYNITQLPGPDHKGPDWFATCFCSDLELGNREWWEQQGISVSDEVWNSLPKSKGNSTF